MQYRPSSVWILLIPVLLLGILAAVLPMFMRIGKRPPDEKWKGPIYSDPEDPSLLVPKRYGIGYTLNFGNPWSWAVLGLIILAALLPIVLAVMNARHLPLHQ